MNKQNNAHSFFLRIFTVQHCENLPPKKPRLYKCTVAMRVLLKFATRNPHNDPPWDPITRAGRGQGVVELLEAVVLLRFGAGPPSSRSGGRAYPEATPLWDKKQYDEEREPLRLYLWQNMQKLKASSMLLRGSVFFSPSKIHGNRRRLLRASFLSLALRTEKLDFVPYDFYLVKFAKIS